MSMVLSHGKLKSLEGIPKKSVPATTGSGSKISTPGSGRKGNPKKDIFRHGSQEVWGHLQHRSYLGGGGMVAWRGH